MTFNQKLVAAILTVALTPVLAAEYETSITLDATKILPKELLSGPNHQVDQNVINDGFLNIYTITTPKGPITAVSTATLRKYVPELDAAARMEKVRGSKEFMAGIAGKAGDVVEGTKALVTDPVETVSGAVSGVGKLFGRAKENMTGGSRSDVETSRLKDLMGYSKSRRDYADQFGVDAYSRNPVLKAALDEISWAGYSGSMTASMALMAVPGGAGPLPPRGRGVKTTGRPGGRPFPPLNRLALKGASVAGAAQERSGVGTDPRERRARIEARVAAHPTVVVQRDGAAGPRIGDRRAG